MRQMHQKAKASIQSFAFLLLVICRYSSRNFWISVVILSCFCHPWRNWVESVLPKWGTNVTERAWNFQHCSNDLTRSSASHDDIVKFGTNGVLKTLVKFLFLTNQYIQIRFEGSGQYLDINAIFHVLREVSYAL